MSFFGIELQPARIATAIRVMGKYRFFFMMNSIDDYLVLTVDFLAQHAIIFLQCVRCFLCLG